MSETEFVIPSQIPWKHLKGRELEECLYWLIDSMGGKELEWRVGGKGAGTSDQGRDLECCFYMSSPEGDLSRQKWWFEAKGRRGTVAPLEVQSAILNAVGKKDIDVLAIVTNTQFSNPTRDWVAEWQKNNPRPVVRLWEKSTLERLCSKHPTVAMRLFFEALTDQGVLELIRTRFWGYSLFSEEPLLERLWKSRATLTWSPEAVLAVIGSEFANGNIGVRPWAGTLETVDCFHTLATGLANCAGVVLRATHSGTSHAPFIKALSYLLLLTLDELKPETVSNILETVWEDIEGLQVPQELRQLIVNPVIGNLVAELRDVCMSDCSRVVGDLAALQSEEIDRYWDRLRIVAGNEEQETQQILTIESYEKPCRVGFSVGKVRHCPICNLDPPDQSILPTMKILSQIIGKRNPHHKQETEQCRI